jgi:hypothetical protein
MAVVLSTGVMTESCTAGNLSDFLATFQRYYSYSPDAFSDPAARDFAEAVAAGRVGAALTAAPAAPGGVNTLGAKGETGLLIAVERGRFRMAKALLEAGADPNGGPDRAPLVYAMRENLPLARLLLEAGANPNGKLDGKPALYWKAMSGEIKLIEMLLAAGANIDEPDGLGNPPSFPAARTGEWTTVEYLLDHGASMAIADQNGGTLAGYAHFGHVDSENLQVKAEMRVIARWQAAGLPWPVPRPAQLREIMARGEWPPASFRDPRNSPPTPAPPGKAGAD